MVNRLIKVKQLIKYIKYKELINCKNLYRKKRILLEFDIFCILFNWNYSLNRSTKTWFVYKTLNQYINSIFKHKKKAQDVTEI